MLNSITGSFCKECIFNNLDCVTFGCKHYYNYQNITNRNGAIFAVEILPRPKFNLKTSTKEYFYFLDADDSKKLIKHEIFNLYKNLSNFDFGTNKIFLNLDRYLLLDTEIVKLITETSCKFKTNNWEVIFSITERQQESLPDLKSTFYRMLLNDILFSTNYSQIAKANNFIIDYNYVKIDAHDIKMRVGNGFNNFINELYLMKESGIRLIAEKIQTKNDYLLIYSMPFDYFQGFYFDE